VFQTHLAARRDRFFYRPLRTLGFRLRVISSAARFLCAMTAAHLLTPRSHGD
jgi:hypothetical protein